MRIEIIEFFKRTLCPDPTDILNRLLIADHQMNDKPESQSIPDQRAE
jgi:hypothetical protein